MWPPSPRQTQWLQIAHQITSKTTIFITQYQYHACRSLLTPSTEDKQATQQFSCDFNVGIHPHIPFRTRHASDFQYGSTQSPCDRTVQSRVPASKTTNGHLSRRVVRQRKERLQRTAGTPGEDCANVLASEMGTATAPVMGSGFCGKGSTKARIS